MNLGSGIRWKLAGSNEDSAEASAFLSKAFGAAIFLIFLVLLAQFNKFTSVWLVLSCVVMLAAESRRHHATEGMADNDRLPDAEAVHQGSEGLGLC